jgi:arabinan endo-1,5-alpha-L-arabinosidase
VGSKYILLYSVSTFGSQDSEIGYASSSTLDTGSWTDHGSTGISSNRGSPFNAIDGNIVLGADGKMHMAFGSFWQDLFLVPLAGGEGSIRRAGEPRQVAFQPAGGHELEAAYVFPHSGAYYLFFSAGKCCALDRNRPPKGGEYRILVCRASRAEGPYVDKSGRECTRGGGTLVLGSHENVYAPGGQGVYEDPVVGTVLYYHYGEYMRNNCEEMELIEVVNTKIGYADGQKKFGWNKVRWVDGWPII